MLFYSFFKTLIGKEIQIELKNDIQITGILISVDHLLNVKINNIKVDEKIAPQFQALTTCFIRGNTI